MAKFSCGESSIVPQVCSEVLVPLNSIVRKFLIPGWMFQSERQRKMYLGAHLDVRSHAYIWRLQSGLLASHRIVLIGACYTVFIFYFTFLEWERLWPLKKFSGLENIFLLQLYLNSGLELMRFANLIHSLVQKSVGWAENYLLSLVEQRTGTISVREPWLS